MVVHPWRHAHDSSNMKGKPNVWGEDADTERLVRGNRAFAKHLVQALFDEGFDTAYAYQPLHHPSFAHAFLNTVLYLDYEGEVSTIRSSPSRSTATGAR